MKFNEATKYLSVSALSGLLNEVLVTALPSLPFEGEVSQLSRPASGHIYFTLKDETSQVSCVIWRSQAQSITFELKPGQQVNCIGRPNFWGGNGRLQMVIQKIQPAGAGELQQRFLELKARLEAEGLFSPERKRSLPFLPKAVGVVTSGTGAVIHDIEFKVHERFPQMPIYLVPVKVQGEGATEEIVRGIKQLERSGLVDVLIVGRGGGSLEDLWSFNEEAVVRAIFGCSLPVISAVGHEVDVTLADLAADVRAPTPTAAAEMAVPNRRDLLESMDRLYRRLADLDRWFSPRLQQIDELQSGLDLALRNSLAQKKMALAHGLAQLELVKPGKLILNLRERIVNHGLRLRGGLSENLGDCRQSLSAVESYLRKQRFYQIVAGYSVKFQALSKRFDRVQLGHTLDLAKKVDNLATRLKLASPDNILNRGYSLVFKQGQVVRAVEDLSLNDSLNIRLARGGVTATVALLNETRVKR